MRIPPPILSNIKESFKTFENAEDAFPARYSATDREIAIPKARRDKPINPSVTLPVELIRAIYPASNGKLHCKEVRPKPRQAIGSPDDIMPLISLPGSGQLSDAVSIVSMPNNIAAIAKDKVSPFTRLIAMEAAKIKRDPSNRVPMNEEITQTT